MLNAKAVALGLTMTVLASASSLAFANSLQGPAVSDAKVNTSAMRPPQGPISDAGHRAADLAHPDASRAAARTKYWKNVWRTAPSYYSGDRATGGYLYAGRNYTYCQATGTRVRLGNYYNYHWLLTDDDDGNRNVWVNAVYFSEGGNDKPVPGVPYC